MANQVRVRPGKPVSLVGMVVGGIFVLLGAFVLVPLFGSFGWFMGAFAIFWTLVAAAIAGYHAVNFFGGRGLSLYEVDVDGGDFDAQLRKLARLKDDGLLSAEEYEQKRAEIMQRKW
jgi:hypothetical protein